MRHELKVWPEYFEPVAEGWKRFEIQKDDRGFKVGDAVVLREWSPESGYSGQHLDIVIRYVMRDAPEFGLAPGYCIFGW